jgi:hypothetical protein
MRQAITSRAEFSPAIPVILYLANTPRVAGTRTLHVRSDELRLASAGVRLDWAQRTLQAQPEQPVTRRKRRPARASTPSWRRKTLLVRLVRRHQLPSLAERRCLRPQRPPLPPYANDTCSQMRPRPFQPICNPFMRFARTNASPTPRRSPTWSPASRKRTSRKDGGKNDGTHSGPLEETQGKTGPNRKLAMRREFD